MERDIIHIDIAAFPVAVERVVEPRLRDRPVVVAGESAARSLVYATSAEARLAGVRRGMLLPQALKLCSDLTVLPPNADLYARATLAMVRILGQFSPVIEPLRFGHAYLDMTGTHRLFGHIKDGAARAQREIRERLRLDPTVGLASNKLVSKVASDISEPLGLCDVKRGDEQGFLAPLTVRHLPGVRRNVREQMLELNVRLIRELVCLSMDHLTMVFGRTGLLLYERARGIDHTPVQPPQRKPEVCETETLPEDSNDFFLLRTVLFRLIAQGARRLRQDGICTRRISIEVRYSDQKEDRGQQRCAATHLDGELFTVGERLFKEVLTRRVRVRKLTVRLCDLCATPRQLSLFESAAPSKDKRLTAAMDRIRDKYGEGTIYFGKAA